MIMTHGSLQEHVYDHIANMFFLHQCSLWLDGLSRVLLSGKKSYSQSVNPNYKGGTRVLTDKDELNEDDDLVLDNFYFVYIYL
jgi:hypothetical protein